MKYNFLKFRTRNMIICEGYDEALSKKDQSLKSNICLPDIESPFQRQKTIQLSACLQLVLRSEKQLVFIVKIIPHLPSYLEVENNTPICFIKGNYQLVCKNYFLVRFSGS